MKGKNLLEAGGGVKTKMKMKAEKHRERGSNPKSTERKERRKQEKRARRKEGKRKRKFMSYIRPISNSQPRHPTSPYSTRSVLQHRTMLPACQNQFYRRTDQHRPPSSPRAPGRTCLWHLEPILAAKTTRQQSYQPAQPRILLRAPAGEILHMQFKFAAVTQHVSAQECRCITQNAEAVPSHRCIPFSCSTHRPLFDSAIFVCKGGVAKKIENTTKMAREKK